jgi:hypothetical protein
MTELRIMIEERPAEEGRFSIDISIETEIYDSATRRETEMVYIIHEKAVTLFPPTKPQTILQRLFGRFL